MSLVEHHGAIFRGIGVSDTGTAEFGGACVVRALQWLQPDH